jgi:hypothetical protein
LAGRHTRASRASRWASAGVASRDDVCACWTAAWCCRCARCCVETHVLSAPAPDGGQVLWRAQHGGEIIAGHHHREATIMRMLQPQIMAPPSRPVSVAREGPSDTASAPSPPCRCRRRTRTSPSRSACCWVAACPSSTARPSTRTARPAAGGCAGTWRRAGAWARCSSRSAARCAVHLGYTEAAGPVSATTLAGVRMARQCSVAAQYCGT